jgi:hypothetical protein
MVAKQRLNHAAHAHWSIANQLYWRLADNSAENLNIWCKWALNALQQVDRQTGQSTQSLMRKVQFPASIYQELARKYFMVGPGGVDILIARSSIITGLLP